MILVSFPLRLMCAYPDSSRNEIASHIAGSPVKIFPNPMRNSFQIQTDGKQLLHYTLSDLTGRMVLQLRSRKTVTHFDCSTLAPGTYFVEIRHPETQQRATQKLVKVR